MVPRMSSAGTVWPKVFLWTPTGTMSNIALARGPTMVKSNCVSWLAFTRAIQRGTMTACERLQFTGPGQSLERLVIGIMITAVGRAQFLSRQTVQKSTGGQHIAVRRNGDTGFGKAPQEQLGESPVREAPVVAPFLHGW